MKKFFLALFMATFATVSFAQEISNTDITTQFKLWMLNNESRAMSELNCDADIIQKTSQPFPFLVSKEIEVLKAENKLWETHRKIYSFLDELQAIYKLAKYYGNGKFAVLVKKTRPEIWGYSGFGFTCFNIPDSVYSETRKAYIEILFTSLGIDKEKDTDLSQRIKAAIRALGDENYRLTKAYFNDFKALYPTNQTIKKLENFIELGSKKSFAPGLKELVKSSAVVEANNNDEDSLSELDNLAESSTEATVNSLKTMEAPDADAATMFDLW